MAGVKGKSGRKSRNHDDQHLLTKSGNLIKRYNFEKYADAQVTIPMIKEAMPKDKWKYVTQGLVDKINSICEDPDTARIIQKNFITYAKVMQGAVVSMDEYVNAIMFVSYRLMDKNQSEAYSLVFPERVKRITERGREVDIPVYASIYAKSALVTSIFEQTMIPSYILNAPMYQDALNTLAGMLRDPNVRGMAKVKACETILNYTKPPEVTKATLDINIKQNDTISQLREVTEQLAEQYRAQVTTGQSSLKEIAESTIVDAEVEDE